MQVNLNFSPTGIAELRQLLDQTPVILFGRIEIGVNEGTAIAVAPRICELRILSKPEINPPLLLVVRSVTRSILCDNRRLKVIGNRNDQVNSPPSLTASEALPKIARKNAIAVRKLRS